MQYDTIEHIIITKLAAELPAHLTYHNTNHIKDVIRMSETIGRSEKVNRRDIILLKTAALFHDTGYLFGAEGHEERSCQIAGEYLPHYGYSGKEVGKIKGMIMATRIPQSPQNLLEGILADADLDYLGRDDFFEIADKLFRELMAARTITSEREWNVLQEKFLEQHHYFTDTAIRTRNPTKRKNLAIIKSKLL